MARTLSVPRSRHIFLPFAGEANRSLCASLTGYRNLIAESCTKAERLSFSAEETLGECTFALPCSFTDPESSGTGTPVMMTSRKGREISCRYFEGGHLVMALSKMRFCVFRGGERSASEKLAGGKWTPGWNLLSSSSSTDRGCRGQR